MHQSLSQVLLTQVQTSTVIAWSNITWYCLGPDSGYTGHRSASALTMTLHILPSQSSCWISIVSSWVDISKRSDNWKDDADKWDFMRFEFKIKFKVMSSIASYDVVSFVKWLVSYITYPILFYGIPTPKHVKYRSPGGWLNITMPSYQYRKYHWRDNMNLWPSHLHNEISCTSKMTSLHWNRVQESFTVLPTCLLLSWIRSGKKHLLPWQP